LPDLIEDNIVNLLTWSIKAMDGDFSVNQLTLPFHSDLAFTTS